ncbi:MAG: hypothetical protein HY908_12900, partial [Myxococcales bacterium]|nr:hypothetical protein [Myxococcales bacterium]
MNEPLQPEPRFGPYELVLELSRGLAGPLFLAAPSADDTGDVVVLRCIDPPAGAAPAALVPLARTMRSAIGLEHPHVVPIVDVVAWNGRVAVASAHIEGVMLDALGRLLLARRVASDVPLAVRLACDLLAGLELLHDSPSYVPGGLAPDAVLVGFDGRARLFEPGLAAGFARLPGVKVPPERRAYRGPEELADEPHAGRQSDLYAVGVMVWEILQRRRLASGPGAVPRAGAAALEVPRVDAAGVPPALIEAVARATRREPDARFATASDMAAALAEALPAAATPEAVAGTLGRTFGGHSDTLRVRAAVARRAERRADAPSAPPPEAPRDAPAPASPAKAA